MRALLGRRYLKLRAVARAQAQEDDVEYDNTAVIAEAAAVDWADVAADTRAQLVAAGVESSDFEIDLDDRFYMTAFFDKEGRVAGVEFGAGSGSKGAKGGVVRMAEAELAQPASSSTPAEASGRWEKIDTGKGGVARFWVTVS